ncbi:cytochrome P450 [Caulobacter ginsengisoli]|uniref:Cytochrome P450 n=1 Tax=Caulobacter ginsengisoli TaxID=400775 RepID=A0ABU0IQ36_9CAUL|nr:cytochrome P450 [Caulobacter ginsengisoli]MDQ0463486.1 cytochrome P450 [Caulobacter ginsengisoli]
MDLLSQTVVEGRRGPNFPPAYPALEGVDLTDIRGFTHGQPFESYARLRAQAPVYWHEEAFYDGPGFWAVTRHADVSAVGSDPETFSSQRGGILMASGDPARRHALLFRASMDAMINMDAPWHMQLRKEHMPFFTPRYLADVKTKVAGEVTRLLDDMAPLGGCDLVEHFSAQLPLFTLCELLGVPQEDRSKFLQWMHYLELAQNMAMDQAANPTAPTLELMQFIQAFNDNVEAMFDYGRYMLHKRRADPQSDLMTAIARAQVEGEQLSDEYLDGSWLLIVFAGNDTTRNTLSGTMKLLTEFPEQRAKLSANPALMPNAVNEFIRMVSPVIYMRRTATRDTELAGQKIAEGEKVIMYYGAANRDEAVFERPDQLDVERANADKHIAFGYGPHVCIGKRVAQIQLEEAYRQILARFPDMRWTGEIDIAPNNFVHAIRKLPVSFKAQQAAA